MYSNWSKIPSPLILFRYAYIVTAQICVHCYCSDLRTLLLFRFAYIVTVQILYIVTVQICVHDDEKIC